jgi:putative membrane protein
MMFPGWGMAGWMMTGGFVLLVVVAVVAVVAVLAVRRGITPGVEEPTSTSPKELLAERLARGEIDEDEYLQRMSVLDSAAPVVPHKGRRR